MPRPMGCSRRWLRRFFQASISGSGLAVLATASNLARLAASVIFGLLWSLLGISQATILYLLALIVAIAAAFFILSRTQRHAV